MLPSWHDCSSLNTASQSSQPHPCFLFTDEPHVPISSFRGRARTEPLGWIVSFPWVFCHKKNLFISKGSWHVVASSASPFYHMPWCRAPYLKGFQGKRVIDFYTFFSLPLSHSNNYSLMQARRGWCAPGIFPRQLCCSRSEAERIVRVSHLLFSPFPPTPYDLAHQLRKYLRATGLFFVLFTDFQM